MWLNSQETEEIFNGKLFFLFQLSVDDLDTFGMLVPSEASIGDMKL